MRGDCVGDDHNDSMDEWRKNMDLEKEREQKRKELEILQLEYSVLDKKVKDQKRVRIIQEVGSVASKIVAHTKTPLSTDWKVLERFYQDLTRKFLQLGIK